MSAIADAGPLNYLVPIGHIDILAELYEKVLVPAAVLRELVPPSAPAAVRSWASNLPPWIQQSDPMILAGLAFTREKRLRLPWPWSTSQ